MQSLLSPLTHSSFICLKILRFKDTAAILSKGTRFFCKRAWNPNAPSPIDLSLIAEYLALCTEELALSIKKLRTLSSISIMSGIKSLLFFHSSKYSKFTEDKQHTAVLSLLVGKNISVQRLDPCIDKPLSTNQEGNFLFAESINIM